MLPAPCRARRVFAIFCTLQLYVATEGFRLHAQEENLWFFRSVILVLLPVLTILPAGEKQGRLLGEMRPLMAAAQAAKPGFALHLSITSSFGGARVCGCTSTGSFLVGNICRRIGGKALSTSRSFSFHDPGYFTLQRRTLP